MPIEVRGNLEGALKRFKTQVARDGILSAAKKHSEHKKPGEKRREAKKEAIKNSRKSNRNNKSNNRSNYN